MFTLLSSLSLIISQVSSGYEPSQYILDFPTWDNPLNISVARPYSKNYIMMIGDWGAATSESTYVKVQRKVADKMKAYYNAQKAKGMNLLFVAAVGDNFYWTGQDCNEWEAAWTQMYGSDLTSVPWMAIKGNHDWGNDDYQALCAWNSPRYTSKAGIPYASNELNKDKGGCAPDMYYMPDFGYYYTINELDFELLALDENESDCPNGLGGAGTSGGASKVFSHCGSESVACGWLGKLRTASENMLVERAQNSWNHNFFIIQHYPGIGKDLVTKFVENRDPSQDLTHEQIVSAYGHTHAQQCDHSYTNANGKYCYSIMTGGGGGCCGEYTRRGFYVMHFDDNKVMTQPLDISDSQLSCTYPCGVYEESRGLDAKLLFDTCCHTRDDPQCHGFDRSKCHRDL